MKASLVFVLGAFLLGSLSHAAEEFTWLKNYVLKSRVKSVDEAVKRLPLKFRSQYSLVYASRATSPTWFGNPRVLMFGDDAKLVIAFTESAKILEVMDFNSKTKNFEFHEIEFKEDGPPEVRENNGHMCLGCHRDGVALWDSGALRPGVYGSQSATYDAKVRSELEKFFVAKTSRPGYRHLIDPRGDRSGSLKKNNEKLSDLLAPMTAQRQIKLLKAEYGQQLEESAPVLVASALGCPDLRSHMTEERIRELELHFSEKVAPRLVNHHQRVAIERSILGSYWTEEDTSVPLAEVRKNFWKFFIETTLDHMASYEFRLLHTNLDSEDFHFNRIEAIIFPLVDAHGEKFKTVIGSLPQDGSELEHFRKDLLPIKKASACAQLKSLSKSR